MLAAPSHHTVISRSHHAGVCMARSAYRATRPPATSVIIIIANGNWGLRRRTADNTNHGTHRQAMSRRRKIARECAARFSVRAKAGNVEQDSGNGFFSPVARRRRRQPVVHSVPQQHYHCLFVSTAVRIHTTHTHRETPNRRSIIIMSQITY